MYLKGNLVSLVPSIRIGEIGNCFLAKMNLNYILKLIFIILIIAESPRVKFPPATSILLGGNHPPSRTGTISSGIQSMRTMSPASDSLRSRSSSLTSSETDTHSSSNNSNNSNTPTRINHNHRYSNGHNGFPQTSSTRVNSPQNHHQRDLSTSSVTSVTSPQFNCKASIGTPSHNFYFFRGNGTSPASSGKLAASHQVPLY